MNLDERPTPETDPFDNLRYDSTKLFRHARKMEQERDEARRSLVAVTDERDALKSARDRAQEDWTETTRLYRDIKVERDALLRGEYICKKCGIRKDGEGVEGDF